MSARGAELAASAGLAAVAGVACVVAWRLGLGDVHQPGAGFMPFATAALLGLMALGRLVHVAVTADRRAGAGPFAQSRRGVVAVVLATLVGYGLLVERLGFTLSTLALVLILFGVVARKRWWVALLIAVGVAVVARLALRALGLQLPDGPLGL